MGFSGGIFLVQKGGGRKRKDIKIEVIFRNVDDGFNGVCFGGLAKEAERVERFETEEGVEMSWGREEGLLVFFGGKCLAQGGRGSKGSKGKERAKWVRTVKAIFGMG